MARVNLDRPDPPDISTIKFALGDVVSYIREETAPDEGLKGKNGPKNVRQIGTVVYIHPKRRYITVEYECNGHRFKESLSPDMVERVKN